MQVLREVDHDRVVDRLAGEARAAAARQDRGAVLVADAVGGDDVVERPRDHHADRRLAVVRGVGRVQRARRGVEPDLALQLAPEVRGERAPVDLDGRGHAAAEAGVDPLRHRDPALAADTVEDAHGRAS